MKHPPFEKFDHYYPFQEEVIDKVLSSKKKIVFINGPPGTGKSLIGMSIAFEFRRSLYLCTTKSLQQQLAKDFMDYPILFGRSNYPCIMSKFTESQFPKISCEDCLSGHEEGEGISCKGRCLYQQAKKIALSAGLAILNTAYYLTETNFIGRFAERNMVIVDECDLLEGALLNFVELNISDSMLSRLKLPPPEYKTKWESWKEWATVISPKLLEQVDKLSKQVTTHSHIDEIRHFRRVKALLSKVSIFKELLNETWIYQEFKHEVKGARYSFKPTWISEIAHQYFWSHAEKFVLMSGTPPIPRTLGLEKEEWDWIEVPSQFPPERRPVYYIGAASLTQKTMDVERPKIIPAIKNILSKHKGEKGLMHTVSYNLASYILNNIQDNRLISHDNGVRDKERLLQRFRDSLDPLVLVSPSMDRGIDLPFDLCRFIIIVKVPYPDLSDKQTAKRLYSSSFGQYWYRGEAVRSIIQMSMRGMRAVEDECQTYIIDSNFENLYSKCHSEFPEWWSKSLEIV